MILKDFDSECYLSKHVSDSWQRSKLTGNLVSAGFYEWGLLTFGYDICNKNLCHSKEI